MKKRFFALFTVVLMFFIASCRDGGTGATGPAGEDGESWSQQHFEYEVFPHSDYTDAADTHIEEGSWDNYGASLNLVLQRNNGTVDEMRGLLYFRLSPFIPSDAAVKKVYLTLYVSFLSGSGDGFACYPVNESWEEGSGMGSATGDGATWATSDGSSSWTAGGNYDTTACSSVVSVTNEDDDDYITFEINSSVVQNWVNDDTQNHGLLLKMEESGTLDQVVFLSNQSGTVCQKPRLTIYYTLP